MEVKPDMKPEPAGGAYVLRSAFESPRIPSAWTVLKTYQYWTYYYIRLCHNIDSCINRQNKVATLERSQTKLQ